LVGQALDLVKAYHRKLPYSRVIQASNGVFETTKSVSKESFGVITVIRKGFL
jgi:hypothetical protein